MEAFCVMVLNVFILGGCAYLVGWMGWNPWWFALAIMCLFKTTNGRSDP